MLDLARPARDIAILGLSPSLVSRETELKTFFDEPSVENSACAAARRVAHFRARRWARLTAEVKGRDKRAWINSPMSSRPGLRFT
jgi:hypothetical protein